MLYKDKNKQCVICWLNIDFNKDQYVKMTDFKGKKELDYCFYHISCWVNKNTIVEGNINKVANEWMDKITKSLGGESKSFLVQ